MNEEKSTLLKKLSKTLAVAVPALAISGFIPVAHFNVSSAIAEGDPEEEYTEVKKPKKKAKKKTKKDS